MTVALEAESHTMPRQRWKFPLDFKTGRLVFTPVLRATGERLHLVVDYASFPMSKAPGFHGRTQDLKTGQWYAIYGKDCDIPGCHCDAWVEEIPAPDQAYMMFRLLRNQPALLIYYDRGGERRE
jgi:hypothetical protein